MEINKKIQEFNYLNYNELVNYTYITLSDFGNKSNLMNFLENKERMKMNITQFPKYKFPQSRYYQDYYLNQEKMRWIKLK